MSYWREGKEQVIYFLKNVPFSPLLPPSGCTRAGRTTPKKEQTGKELTMTNETC
jgi:hypothetical protein